MRHLLQKLGLLLVLCGLAVAASGVHAGRLIPLPSARAELSLNGPWTLQAGGSSRQVEVPTNIDFTYGPSVWTRRFTIPGATRPNLSMLYFGGVVNSGVVRLNGVEVGRLSAFTPALLAVEHAIVFPGENLLEVTLEDRLTDNSTPGGPTELFLAQYGNLAYNAPVAWANRPGIIRDVSLVYSSQPLIIDSRVEQVFDATLGSVDLTTTLRTRGALGNDAHAMVAFAIDDVVKAQCNATVVAADTLRCTVRIDQPRLWSTTAPALYNMSAILVQNNAVADAGRDRIGLRKFEARGTRFYLNNQPIFLRGISRHDIYGPKHFVPDETLVHEDLVRIRALGVNFIRSIHYPPSEMFVRAADEYGMLLALEIPAWANTWHPEVITTASGILRTVMERDFNRPSVVMVLLATISGQRPDFYLDTLIGIARGIDRSRLVSFVFDDAVYSASDVAANVDYAARRAVDFYAQNSYWPGQIYADVHDRFPTTMPYLNTEWSGSEGSDRGPLGPGDTRAFPTSYLPYNGVYPETYQAISLSEAFSAFYPYVCNTVRTTRCLAGTVFFNWQDVEWPGMIIYYPNHYPMLRNGLVYEDRVGKAWPLAIFSYLYQWLRY